MKKHLMLSLAYRAVAAGCALLSMLGTVHSRTGDDWSRFRGPDGAGTGTAPVPVSFRAADYDWRIELPGRGHSSPVIWNDRIFLTCTAGDGGGRSVVCIDRAAGKLLWTHAGPFEAHRQHRLNSFASATPVVDADRVYVAWTDGAALEVLALTHDGKEAWRTTAGTHSARHGSAVSPILVGDVIVVANDNEGEQSCLIGLDRSSGEVRWRRERTTSRAAYATPTVWRRDDGSVEVLFASTAHGLSSVDPESGSLLWEVGGLFEQRCVASPVVADGIVFLTAGSGGGGKESAAVALPVGDRKAAVAYRLDRALPYVPTAVAHGPHLFLWADGGIVTCVVAASGERVWQERIGGKYFGSPICVDGKIYCMSVEGELVVIAAADTFQQLARIDLGEASHATPAVQDGVLYLRTIGHLIAVGGRVGAKAPGPGDAGSEAGKPATGDTPTGERDAVVRVEQPAS